MQDTGAIIIQQVRDASLQIKLYEDNNGALGQEVTDAVLGNSFFVEILLGDIRVDAAGLLSAALDFGFAADVIQNIDDPFDPSDVNSPLVTSDFPLFREGILDNANGLIDNLRGGSVPAANEGTAHWCESTRAIWAAPL